MASAGQAPLHRSLQLLLQCPSLGVALEQKASAKRLKCDGIAINKAPDAARREFGWNRGAPERPQSSRVEDGEVFPATPPPPHPDAAREEREMPIKRRLSLPTQSGAFGPIRHNKSKHLRGWSVGASGL